MGIPLRAILRELNRRNISFAYNPTAAEKELEILRKAEKELRKYQVYKDVTPQEKKLIREKIWRIQDTLPARPYDFIFDKGFKRMFGKNELGSEADKVFNGVNIILQGLNGRAIELVKKIQQGK